MRIALAIHSLAGRGGTETYTLTVADHLQRLGHDVWVIAAERGRGSELAGRLGIRVADSALGLPQRPDAVISQDAAAAYEAQAELPGVPQLYVAHSDIFDMQLPPQLPGVVGAVVVMHDRVEQRVRALALEQPVIRLSQPIDVQAFAPTRALPARPRVALALSNYIHGERGEMLTRACERAGIELQRVGLHAGGETASPAETYNAADIVFGKARVVFEAMACGRAVYVLDHNGAEGWVTDENRARLARDNFGGQSEPIAIDERILAADLERYDPASGLSNRDFVVAHNAAGRHAAEIVEALRDLAPGSCPDAPLAEMARLVRAYHRADAQAMVLRAELERVNARLADAAARADAAERRAGEEQARTGEALAQAAQARVELTRHAILAAGDRRSASEARERLALVEGSSRWRAVQAALAPLDRARRRGPRPAGGDAAGPPPAPFVVGVPRSGTTLLRLRLDAHPQLAIGPETRFGLVLEQAAAGPAELAAAIQQLETWPDLGLGVDELAELLAAVQPWSAGAGLRAIYRSYAARHGKPLWGDRTPLHVERMAEIANALPEAHFVHLIRDGRDVAVSLRPLPFAPADGSIEALAALWSEQIAGARSQARELPHYRELRFEDLVTDTAAELERLSRWLGLEPSAEMLAAHVHTTRPPDAGRSGRWREELSTEEVERFEQVAGDMLEELGYPLARA